jgi:ankyrin repeat protein
MANKAYYSWILALALLIIGCRDIPVERGKLSGYDYRLFQNTPVWELAKAVQDKNISKINRLVKEEELNLNYQEPRFGSTLLMLTVRNENFKSCKALLELGANPNIHDYYDGTSPIIEAANNIGTNKLKFLKLLLENGADPNDEEVGPRRPDNPTRYTPLLQASENDLASVRLLVGYGANINYKNELEWTPLSVALTQDKYDIALYLLNNGADYRQPVDKTEGKYYYLWDELRFRMYPLNSSEYMMKMRIVDFLKKKGIDYHKTPVPPHVVEQIKADYPDNWEEYLQKY